MDPYLIYIFVGNIFLTFVDATIGYHTAPTLARIGASDEEGVEWATRGVRKLLAGVVALYMFFNCLAFFNGRPLLLVIVSGVVVLDIVCQIVLARKMGDRQNQQ